MLLTWHNVRYYQDLMRGLHTAITDHRLDAFADAARVGWAQEMQT
jgi:queuine tRNA-ribosyltransferase